MPNDRATKAKLRLERLLQTLDRCAPDAPDYVIDDLEFYLALFEPIVSDWEFMSAQTKRLYR